MEQRTIIPVSINPADNSSFIRFRSTSSSGIHDKMSQRMREFEEECREWREKFFKDSRMGKSSSMLDRPRMNIAFPEFPEFSTDLSTSGQCGPNASSYKSYIEEDLDGRKKYKIQFDIGDFKPSELSLRTEGRTLIVKGDRQVVKGNATESKQFNRELTLPEFVDYRNVTSFMSYDGYLIVEAPVMMEKFGIQGKEFQPLDYRQSPSKYSSIDSQRSYNKSSFVSNRSSPHRDVVTTINSPRDFKEITTNPDSVTYKFELRGFRPPEVAIMIDDKKLSVHAVQERNEYDGKYSREFSREVDLPEGACTQALRNSFYDGILTIEIPIKNVKPSLIETRSTESGSDLRLKYELHGYRPDDVTVKVTDDVLKVHAVRTDDSRSGEVEKEFVRHYRLPAWTDVDKLRARMSDDGTLTVEVPRRIH